MNRLYSFFNILAIAFLCSCLTACVDDGLGFDADDLREGETTLNLEAAFSPFAEGNLTRASLTPPGRGFNELSDLAILVYDKEGNIFRDEDGKPFIREITFDPNDVKDENRGESDTSNGKQPAETDTKSLKNIQLKLPFGEYYIIGVANLGSYTESGVTTSSYDELTTKYADACATLDGLRRIKVEWESDNYRNNREMLGYFADPEAQSPRASSTFPTVKVNRPGMQLRAWLRRCASKITIDFDGSALRENVYIYIKDARIYDLAKECTLGFGNAGTADESVADYNNAVINEEGLTQSSHHIEYGEGEDFSSWPCITKGEPYIMENNKKKVFHTQESEALYFYENMQGTGNDRTPVPDLSSGNVAGGFNEKDGKEFGTYIEVTAHYHSDADGNIADYDIKYRFMIGKDVTTNYDAERNYHYKLTLKFRGNANEYHWHIDYDEPEGFDVPNPWYVSYLYNHTANLPFKYIPPTGWKVAKIDAEIVKNPWFPSDFGDNLDDTEKEIVPCIPDGDDAVAYNDSRNRLDCNGFLSLRETTEPVITEDMAKKGFKWVYGTDANSSYNKTETDSINYYYYYGLNESGAERKVDRSKRTYYFDGTTDPDDTEAEAYSYKKDGDKLTFNIPLFTRAKVMVKPTGYSGNNPFVGYQRIARIKLTATIRKVDESGNFITGADGKYIEDTKEALTNVIQVRRVINPKGVYRRWDNSEPFNVKLAWLGGDNADSFDPVISRGPWKAEIIGDDNFITLDGKKEVSGSTNSQIKFSIRFNRLNLDKSKVQNAVVRIIYHNYTCTHLIFVRRGYEPQEIAPNTKAWSSFNMINRNLSAKDPRDEGSLFKFGNSSEPIDAVNNAYLINGKEDYRIPSSFPKPSELQILGAGDNNNYDTDKINKTVKWADIAKNSEGFTEGEIAKAAEMKDFESLYLAENMQFGYGILYADGATETQMDVNKAYGYYRRDPDNKENGDSEKGMRGLFAYYWDKTKPDDPYTARNLFFPIGRSGYGHRKNKREGVAGGESGDGVLRYACGRGAANSMFSHAAPLFVSIYRREGAIYWSRKVAKNIKEWNNEVFTGDSYGMDINYFSFDVNLISASNIDSGGDACFVRTVVDN